MSYQFSGALATAVLVAILLAGCTKADDPPCADLDKITDPVAKADLEKRCPRAGPTFKPTPPKSY